MKAPMRFVTATIFALLILPGSANATFIGVELDLGSLLGGSNGQFSSGTTFSSPITPDLGWDLTISSGSGANLAVNSVNGLGVAGNGAGNAIGIDEAVRFDFTPVLAELLGFTIINGANESAFWSTDGSFGFANPGPGVSLFDVAVAVDTSSLTVAYAGGAGDGYRIGSLFFNEPIPVAKVPEPSIIALFAAGILGIGFARRRMRS